MTAPQPDLPPSRDPRGRRYNGVARFAAGREAARRRSGPPGGPRPGGFDDGFTGDVADARADEGYDDGLTYDGGVTYDDGTGYDTGFAYDDRHRHEPTPPRAPADPPRTRPGGASRPPAAPRANGAPAGPRSAPPATADGRRFNGAGPGSRPAAPPGVTHPSAHGVGAGPVAPNRPAGPPRGRAGGPPPERIRTTGPRTAPPVPFDVTNPNGTRARPRPAGPPAGARPGTDRGIPTPPTTPGDPSGRGPSLPPPGRSNASRPSQRLPGPPPAARVAAPVPAPRSPAPPPPLERPAPAARAPQVQTSPPATPTRPADPRTTGSNPAVTGAGRVRRPGKGADRASARILDRGYRGYEGPRRGRIAAVRSVIRQTMRASLGLRRPPTAKIFPVLAVVCAYLPAIVFVGMTLLVKADAATRMGMSRFDVDQFLSRFLPSYAHYYGYIVFAIVVFVGFVAPEVLCGERRNGLLGLYLASPLNRDSYLVAKAIAVTGSLLLVTLGPPLVYLIGMIANGKGPKGLGGIVDLFARVVAAGVVVTALYVALSFAVSSTTTRRPVASAGIVLALVASWVTTESLAAGAGVNPLVLLFNITILPLEVVFRIHGDDHVNRYWGEIGTPTVIAAFLAWTLALALFARIRYQRTEVTR